MGSSVAAVGVTKAKQESPTGKKRPQRAEGEWGPQGPAGLQLPQERQAPLDPPPAPEDVALVCVWDSDGCWEPKAGPLRARLGVRWGAEGAVQPGGAFQGRRWGEKEGRSVPATGQRAKQAKEPFPRSCGPGLVQHRVGHGRPCAQGTARGVPVCPASSWKSLECALRGGRGEVWSRGGCSSGLG